MPKIIYVQKNFNDTHHRIINQANQIINTYAAQGYDLTLRQLYYQFVARDWFPEAWQDPQTHSTNNERSYKKLGSILSDARRAGMVDWDRIVDRTRNVRIPSFWDTPADIINSSALSYNVDWWETQEFRPEVWVEKDALVGVLETACSPWHCPYFSCRGYASDSETWGASQRLDRWIRAGQTPIIFHLGDHDPSGIDMSRDITDRVALFCQDGSVRVVRIALTMKQVEEVKPPPNPAKHTDSRFKKYRRTYGNKSWELDALDPTYIGNLIKGEMEKIIDKRAWKEKERERDDGKKLLERVSSRWAKLVKLKLITKPDKPPKVKRGKRGTHRPHQGSD